MIASDINALGGQVQQLPDSLVIYPGFFDRFRGVTLSR